MRANRLTRAIWTLLALAALGGVLEAQGTIRAGLINLATMVTGVLPSANGGAGSVSGILAANGSGTTSAYGGTTCTTQALTALSSAGAGTCTTITSAYVDSSIALTGSTLAQFASTSSAQLRGVLSDETGTGAAVFQGGDLGSPTGLLLTLTRTAIGVQDYLTAHDSLILQNTTASTSGVTIQSSPGLRFLSHSWISGADHQEEMVLALLPATTNAVDGRPGHTLEIYSITDSGTATEEYRLTGHGNLLTRSSIDAGALGTSGDLSAAAANGIYWRTHSIMASTSDALWQLTNSSVTKIVELNVGTAAPTVSSCGTSPTVGALSNNTAGSITTGGSTGTSCTVTFGSPAWTNTPKCIVQDLTRASVLRLSALSATAFTMTGTTSSDQFIYHCIGGS